MKCNDCIALRLSYGYETYERDETCAVGEEEIEFCDGSIGCKRRSVEKLKRDIVTADEEMTRAMVSDMGAMADFVAEKGSNQ